VVDVISGHRSVVYACRQIHLRAVDLTTAAADAAAAADTSPVIKSKRGDGILEQNDAFRRFRRIASRLRRCRPVKSAHATASDAVVSSLACAGRAGERPARSTSDAFW